MRVENIAQMAVIVNDNKVLALEFQNYDNAPIEGKWVLPGGRPDVGEQVHDALKREVLEETELEIDVVEPLHINNFNNWDGKPRIRLTYLCKLKENKEIVLSHEHKNWKWVGAEDVDGVDWIDADFKEIVRRAVGNK